MSHGEWPPTVFDAFARNVADVGGREALGICRAGSVDWLTWNELAGQVCAAAAALAAWGVEPGDRVAQLSENRREWIVLDLAAQAVRAVHVPLHAALSGRQAVEQVRHAGAKIVFVSNREQAAKLDRADEPLSDSIPRIVYDVPAPGEAAAAELERWTAAKRSPDEPATILYTSGTSGRPKGVVLSHANLARNAAAMVRALGQRADDTRLGLLPLSHAFGRTCDLNTWLVAGYRLALARGRDTVPADCVSVRPTLLNGVPFFFERIYRQLHRDGRADEPGCLRRVLGGKLRMCCSGGGALPAAAFDYYQAQGLPILEGYGLTEASPVVTAATPTSYKKGTVGPPIPGVEIRIGEGGRIETRGPHVMLGYWRDERATQAALSDGFLRTGDVGSIDADGMLRVDGRHDEMIVTTTGLSIPPARQESLLAADSAIAQAMVVGTGKDYPAALIVPSAEGRPAPSEVDLRSRVGQAVSSVSADERIRKYVLLDRPWTVERGELTAKGSLCRETIAAHCAEAIRALYADGDSPKRHATAAPVYRAVWDPRVPVELFDFDDDEPSRDIARIKSDCMACIREHQRNGTLLDADGKLSDDVLADLAASGYWGLAIDRQFGGAGATLGQLLPLMRDVAAENSALAALASVHGCIGPAAAIGRFGSPSQRERFLPDLAAGRALCAFALTEPAAGSDTSAIRTEARRSGNRYLVTGQKLFITNAAPCRTVLLVCRIDEEPAVLVCPLPATENEHFRLHEYGLHPLRQTHNRLIEFRDFPVPIENRLSTAEGHANDMAIVHWCLGRGRAALCANAAGKLRRMLADLVPWVRLRRTFGRPIGERQLVQCRLGRAAARIVACDALARWSGRLLDRGYRGQLECMVAKMFASEALRHTAVELVMKTHGGRSLLAGHPLGDGLYDCLAPTIYEGENDVLALGLFHAVARHRLAESPDEAAWRVESLGAARLPEMPAELSGHAERACEQFRRIRERIERFIDRFGPAAVEEQCRCVEAAGKIRDLTAVLCTALFAARSDDPTIHLAAEVMCDELAAAGRGASDGEFEAAARLGRLVADGRFPPIADVTPAPILMPYDERSDSP